MNRLDCTILRCYTTLLDFTTVTQLSITCIINYNRRQHHTKKIPFIFTFTFIFTFVFAFAFTRIEIMIPTNNNYSISNNSSFDSPTMRIKSDTQIRHRLIRSLGINKSSTTTNCAMMRNCYSKKNQKNILTASTQEVPLKNHCAAYNNKIKTNTNTNTKTTHKPDIGTRIQFNSVVQSMPIPSHLDYSDRVKRLIWSNCSEIRQNAQRNAREFAFEGWSAQYVLEEDQMYLDVGSMEFIHPVHVVGYS